MQWIPFDVASKPSLILSSLASNLLSSEVDCAALHVLHQHNCSKLNYSLIFSLPFPLLPLFSLILRWDHLALVAAFVGSRVGVT